MTDDNPTFPTVVPAPPPVRLPPRFAALAVLVTCSAFCASARADVLVMRNGDHLTGKAVHKMADTLTFSTSYAGTLTLKWSDIVSLTTDKPVTLVIGNERLVSGKLAAGTAQGRAAFTPATTAPAPATSATAPATTAATPSTAAPAPPPASGATATDAATTHAAGTAVDPAVPRDLPLDSVRFLNPTVEESGRGILWNGRINAGGADTSGNTTNSSLHVDVDTTGRARHYRILGGGEFNRATDHEQETVSNWRAHGEFDRFYEKKMFSYTRSTFEHDKFKALDLRSTLGAGLGYQFFESAPLNLSLQAGIDYVDVNNMDVPDDRYAAGAWVLRYDQKPWNWNVQFFHQQDGTISLNSPSNIVLHTQTGMRAPLGGGINATLQYNYDWNNRPPAGRFSADRTLLFTLGYAW